MLATELNAEASDLAALGPSRHCTKYSEKQKMENNLTRWAN